MWLNILHYFWFESWPTLCDSAIQRSVSKFLAEKDASQIYLGPYGRGTSLAALNYDMHLSIIHPLYKSFFIVIV